MDLPSSDPLLNLALELAVDLPAQDIASISRALRGGAKSLHGLRQSGGSARVRHAINSLLALPESEFVYLSGVLAGATAVAERSRLQQSSVVWTGPASSVDTARLTPVVVAELLHEAQHEVLIVGYAVQESAGVREALSAAVARGVLVSLLLERQTDNPNFHQTGHPLHGIASRRLSWPAAARGPHASLHAKILVVDRISALIGSANLTGAAMERNLECGLLLRGGPHPDSICQHVEALQEAGVLQRIPE